MLFYDMFLTFGEEVEKIWTQRFTGATILWFLVSILAPKAVILSADSDLPEPLPIT